MTPGYRGRVQTGAELVTIPAGAFRMGSEDGLPDERPVQLRAAPAAD